MKSNFIKYLIAGVFVIAFITLKEYSEDFTVGIIFFICGIGFLFAGFYMRNTNRRIETNGIKTKAKIIDFVEDRVNDSLYHFPVVRFTDKNGIATTQKLNSSANPKKINQFIDIIYLKKGNDYEIMINSTFWKNYFPMAFIIGGFLFSGIGIAIFLKEMNLF